MDSNIKTIFIIVIVTAINIGLAVIISEVQSKYGTNFIFLSLTIFLVILFFFIVPTILVIGLLVIPKKITTKLENEQIEITTNLKNSQNEIIMELKNEQNEILEYAKKLFNFNQIDIILTTKELISLEDKKAKTEVWILTSDLVEDGVDGPFFKVVSKNLKKGIIYRYFIPKEKSNIKTMIERIKTENNSYFNKNLFFYCLEDDFFFLISQFDFGIINPKSANNKERYGFLGISYQNSNGIEERFQIKISNKIMDEIIGKLNDYVCSTKYGC